MSGFSSDFRRLVLSTTLVALAAAIPLAAAEETKHEPAPTPAPAPAGSGAAALDRLKALAGDWVDADGSPEMKGKIAVTYHVTGAGSAVVETLVPGTPHEMVSVYHRDGDDLVMTHYCAAQNQPRMRAKTFTGNVIALDFDGGTNLDPAKDMHIHGVRIELLGPDEIREEWIGWNGGKLVTPATKFHLKRKSS